MIVSKMTPQEVYKELERDKPLLAAWWSHQRDALEKKAKRMTKFPMVTWFDHTTPRKNRYLILSVVYCRRYFKANTTCFVALQKREDGTAIYFTRLPNQILASPIALLPHVLDRYDQRCGIKKQGLDLIRHYIEHNYMGQPVEGRRFSGRSVRYKDRDNVCLSIPDGVLLGEMLEKDIFVAHTFITYQDASGLQRVEFENKKKSIIPQLELGKQIRNIYNKFKNQ